MAENDSLMPDPSLLLSEDRDKNVAEWLVGQIFGTPAPAANDPAGSPTGVVFVEPTGELDGLAQGLFAQYFGETVAANPKVDAEGAAADADEH